MPRPEYVFSDKYEPLFALLNDDRETIERLGLQGVRERVNKLQGKMQIEGAPGHGARIVVEIGNEEDPGTARR